MNVFRNLVGKSSKGHKGEDTPPLPQAENIADQQGDEKDESQEDRKKLWSKVSGLIGKDTTSLLSLPVSMFEPTSVLQNMCEPLRYTNIIEQICVTEDPIDRICLVAAFCIAYFAGYNRTVKPFNPVLGETFEYVPKNKRYKSMCEQVSHHPPIGIAYTTADEWSLHQESHIETKFWGNTVDVFSLGNNDLKIKDEHFSWTAPATCIHNIIFGRIWIERTGSIPIKNKSTGDTCTLSYRKSGWFEGINHDVSGEIHDKDGNLRASLIGKYNDTIYVTKVDKNGKKSEPVELWKAPKDDLSNKWKWPAFVFELTALHEEEHEHILPKSDSRWRGDLRALLALNTKLAGKEKTRIEESERAKRREREATNQKWTPVYFEKPEGGGSSWKYIGNYWEERDKRIAEHKLKQSVTQTSEALDKVKIEDDIKTEPLEEQQSPRSP